jgi:hypothetical protein
LINCQPDFYWSSTAAYIFDDITFYYFFNFSNGKRSSADEDFAYRVLPIRRVSEEDVKAFKKAEMKKGAFGPLFYARRCQGAIRAVCPADTAPIRVSVWNFLTAKPRKSNTFCPRMNAA